MTKREQLHPTRDSLSRAIITHWALQLIQYDEFSMRFEAILETREEHLARRAR
jgi:hypothetical protein